MRLLSVAGLLAAALTQTPSTDSALLDRALALHKQAPVIDGHNDYPWELRQKAQSDLDKLDISKSQPSIMTDIDRLRRGGVGGQFWSVYVPGEMQGQTAVTATLEQIDIVHRMLRKYPETFELALTSADVTRAIQKGKIASLIGMEGGHSIDNSLGALRLFHRLGARYMTLTHNKNLPWADCAAEPPVLGGLSPFGENVVREMNWLGMLVDLSHVSPDTMADALAVTQAPVIFSHSNARAVTDVPRNVPDNILQLVKKNNGIVMVTFVPSFASSQVAAWQKERDRVKEGGQAWEAKNPAPRATIADVANHIDHIRKVAGIDHIGIGGDFDGISSVVQGLEDVSTYPALTAELLRRGYKDDEIKKILGLNIVRVMREAEAVSARLQKARPASPTLFVK
jgi:membrane dipeptidase